GHSAADLGLRARPGTLGGDRLLCRAAAAGRAAAGAGGWRAGSAQAVDRRAALAVRAVWRRNAPHARRDGRVVRLRGDAVRAMALPVREPGGVATAFPGRFHLRGRGPDAWLVLLADGDLDDA